MQRIALLILCLAAISCDKKVVKSVDVPVEDVAVEEALTEDVLANAGLMCSGSLQLPTRAGLLAEDLQVYSLYDEATPNAAGAFSISMTESTNPQFVVAIDPATETSLLLGYVDPLQSDQVHLSCTSTAVSLAFLSPLMLGTTAEQRSEFIHGIKTHPNFPLLVAAVEATLQADPQHMLDGETHPALYDQAAAIAVEVWQDMAAAGKLLAPEAAQADNICEEEGKEYSFWLAEEPVEGNLAFCNRRMLFYVALIGQVNEDFADLVQLQPQPRPFTPRIWPPRFVTPAVPTYYALPVEGQFQYVVSKGYDYRSAFNLGAFLDWNTPYGRASQLNLLLGFSHILSLLGQDKINFAANIITSIFDPNDGWDFTPLEALGSTSDARDSNPVNVVVGIANFLYKNYTKNPQQFRTRLAMLIARVVPKDKIIKYQLQHRIFNTVLKNFKTAGLAIKGYKFTTGLFPFMVDMRYAQSQFVGEFTYQGGDLSLGLVPIEEVPEPPWEEQMFALVDDLEMAMVKVEAGRFQMGSAEAEPNESPVHEVAISEDFWLGQYEVTRGQWEAVMGTTPWAGREGTEADRLTPTDATDIWEYEVTPGAWAEVMGTPPAAPVDTEEGGAALYPATYVSWNDVQEFIARLNAQAGERRYRLPTEAEWEYACRAGTTTRWSFGDDQSELTDYAWLSTDSQADENPENPRHPQMVGLYSKRPNAWGLYEMHGNVGEWVQDWYDPNYYAFSPLVDPQGPAQPFLASHPQRVVRGSSFKDFAWRARSASRSRFAPDERKSEIGFRLVRLAVAEPLERVTARREQTFYPGNEAMAMVWIEPGAFAMGTSDYPNASPHEVEISTGFWLGQYEVTQAQWEAVMGGTAWAAPWAGQSHVQVDAGYPATYVSWEAVQEFIARLNDAEGGWYYRLPTEAEWEYACRAGTTTRWSFGDDERDLEYFAWYSENARDDAPGDATLKRANAWGLRGMHGNVAEWVQDWYDRDYYANSPPVDPQGPAWPPFADADAVPHRVIRGGSFNTLTAFTESAFRWIAPPGSGSPFIGFRLVRDEVSQEPPTRTVSLPGGTEIKFVRVEPGVFQMGSDHGDANERPVHEVEISTGFWLGKYEVTQAQWEAVMEPPSTFASRWAALSESHPAIGISWNMAQEFIDSLNEQAGERRYRLPSEAEWEYACRAGMPTQWSFGDDVRRLADYAWYNTSGVNEVGLKRPNFWGLYDMHGNVQEWVQDWYGEGYYANSPVMDPAGPATGNARVRRGGIYSNQAESVRSARRAGSNPINEDVSFGFRLVMLDRPEELPVEEPVEEGGTVGEESTVSLPGGAEMAFVWIEPGVFQMGSPESEEGRRDNEDLHEVEISTGFYLGKYEITQGQWEAVMGTTPWSGRDYVQENPSHPAVYISQNAVQEFVGLLNAASGDSLYRLPSEAEWEYACRAGTQTRWSFGDDASQLTDYAWYKNNAWDVGEQYAHAVGTKLPNPWRLYDMHGNVAEWVQDWYDPDYYKSSPRVDPPGPDIGSSRVIRSGGFNNNAGRMRSAYRSSGSPVGGWALGVRLVMIGRPGEVLIDPPEEEPPVDGGGTVGEESTVSLPGGAEMAFVWIEPGVFQMGATESEIGAAIDGCVDLGVNRSYCADFHGWEGPLHEVEISTGFYLGKYEITQGQWEAVMGTTPWSGSSYARSNPSHPAVYISWDDVQEFVGRLNAASGDSLYRLPSEAEWEYACRAGTQTRWSFGDDERQLTDYAWYKDNAWDVDEQYAHAVGTKLPNAWGLYDMHGNVFEWVRDWWGYYNSSPRVDPPGPDIGSNRVLRSGNFNGGTQYVRSAGRNRTSPGDLNAGIGARLVRIR